MRKASDFTSMTPSGSAHSGVAEILHDLRALYGEALFARKGIAISSCAPRPTCPLPRFRLTP